MFKFSYYFLLKGGIPPELRAAVWAALLGVRHADAFLLDQAIVNTTKDLENQRIIKADAGIEHSITNIASQC